MPEALPCVPRLLLVGACGRNAGKTRLACRIISRFAAQGDLVAVKLTVSDGPARACPRGGAGCGTCADIGDGYTLVVEDGGDTRKDTAQMKAAGAARVYWVRSSRARLADAFAALLDRIGPHGPIVCESTSLRACVVPGVFLLARRRTDPACKPSAALLAEHADRTVWFGDEETAQELDDLSLDRATFRWRLQHKVTAIVMAGGESTRMGRNKALLPIAGTTAIARACAQLGPYFKEVLISGRLPHGHAVPGVRMVPDRTPGRGPLMGLACTLAASVHDRSFVRACDIPDLDADLVGEMLRQARHADLVVPRTAEGRADPLFAVYRKSVLPAIERALAAGEGRISAIFESCHVRSVPVVKGVLANLNTPGDWTDYRNRLLG